MTWYQFKYEIKNPVADDGDQGSAQISDDQEHEDAGEQHAPDHDELILSGSPLYQSHHCVGQPEHVGYVQHLLVCALHKARKEPVTTLIHTHLSGSVSLATPLLTHQSVKRVSQPDNWDVGANQQTHPDKRRPEPKPGRPSP